MALSEQEQQMLREIEESLLAEDPKFGSTATSRTSFDAMPADGKLTMRSLAIIVLGLVLLVGGMALAAQSVWFVTISIIGFAVMFFGGLWALRTPNTPSAGGARLNAGEESKSSGMSARMEENFRRRFEEP